MDALVPQVVNSNSYKEVYEAPSVSQWTKSDMFYLSLKIAALALACTFFPYRRVGYVFAGYELTRHVIQRLIMIPLYPLQSRIARFFEEEFRQEELDIGRLCVMTELRNGNYHVDHIGLKMNGVVYTMVST